MLQDGMVFSSPEITLNAEPKEVGKHSVARCYLGMQARSHMCTHTHTYTEEKKEQKHF